MSLRTHLNPFGDLSQDVESQRSITVADSSARGLLYKKTASWAFFTISMAMVFVSTLARAQSATFDLQTCPKNDVEWRSFQDSGAVKLVSAAANDDSTVSNIARKISATFNNCSSLNVELWNSRPDLLASLANLRKFTAARSVEGLDHFAMGFNVPDTQYFAETSVFTAVPSDLQTPEILSAFSDPKRIDEALRMLEDLNKTYAPDQQMIFFRYTSQHLTTPDASRVFGRVLVVVPGRPDSAGNKIDRWVQFGVPEAGKGHTQNVSVVAIVTHSDKTTDVYFKDHFRMFDKNAIYLKSRFEVNGTGDSCVACHKSGILPIFPKPGSLAAIDQPKLDSVNHLFRAYGPPSFGGYLNPADEGPGLGATDDVTAALRTPAFLASCTTGLRFDNEADSHSKIASNMSCAECHNSKKFGNLNYPLNTTEIDSYVRAGLMPPRSKLNANEKEGLLRCLKSEYLGPRSSQPALLLNWLRGTWNEVVQEF